MHYGRIVALIGVIVTVVGLFLKSASSAAEAVMADLNLASEGAIPSEFTNVWTGIWDDKAWAAITLVIALVAIVVLCFVPVVKNALSRMNGLIMVVLGVVVLAIGGVATMTARGDAGDLADAFAGMFAQQQLPEAYSVDLGIGWILLIIGGAVVAIGGVLSLMARPEESALTDA